MSCTAHHTWECYVFWLMSCKGPCSAARLKIVRHGTDGVEQESQANNQISYIIFVLCCLTQCLGIAV